MSARFAHSVSALLDPNECLFDCSCKTPLSLMQVNLHLRFLVGVSAGAKIPIVPVEFSPSLNVVNRRPLHTEEVPRLVKGERRARTERTATARNEHPGHQQVDRLGPQDDSQVHAGGGVGTGIWPTLSTAEQARFVQAVFGTAAARRSVERASVAARIARA